MPQLLWRVHMLGGLRVVGGGAEDAAVSAGVPDEATVITRFRSQKIGALLAYLALFRTRAHSREELADLFWPDGDPEAGRSNLRTALASLRRQLEPPGVEAGAVLVADGRSQLRLNPETVTSDVASFEALLAAAGRATTAPPDQIRLLTEAAELYRGPLLPGFYETWALAERDRLGEAHQHALKKLTLLHASAGQFGRAVEWARKAVAADPLREESQAVLIKLLMRSGERAAAQRQYDEAVRLLDEQLGIDPSSELKAALREPAAAPQQPGSGSVPTGGPGTTLPPLSPRKLDLSGGEPAGVPDPAPPSSTVGGAATSFATATRPPAAYPDEGRPAVVEEQPAPAAPAVPVHLPLTLTRFFGREGEMARIAEGLTDPTVRLLTLTGPGGSGKTRLAIESARRLAADGAFPGGVWFVPLVEVREGDRIPDVLLGALGLSRSPIASAQEVVADHLNGAGAAVLLVLDNFEQLVEAEAGADSVRDLLALVGSLTCLVTSRQKLLLDGERELTVAPLPTPGNGARVVPGTPDRMLEFASVQMFVDRAQAARPDFTLTARNADAVAALCVKLEGIPLAIELAAAWSQTLTPSQILERIGNTMSGGQQARFDLLVSRKRGGSPRHATLRAALDWSYRMLPPEMQAFFDRLSVFREGWSLEAAEAVTEEPDRALPFLSELRDRSLVFVEVVEDDLRDVGGGPSSAAPDAEDDEDAPGEYVRMRMLETLREFAEERMAEASDEERAELARRHCDYYVSLAERTAPQLHGPHQVHHLRLLESEHGNFRTALQYALSDPAAPPMGAERLVAGLWWFWLRRGYFVEGRQRIEDVLARAPEDLAAAPENVRLAYVRVLMGRTLFGYFQGDYEASAAGAAYVLALTEDLLPAAAAERSLAMFNQALLAINDLDLSLALGSPEAVASTEELRSLVETCLTFTERAGLVPLMSRPLMAQSWVHMMRGEAEEARRCSERSVAVLRPLRDAWELSNILCSAGAVERFLGDYEASRRRYSEVLTLARCLDSHQPVSWALWGMAGALLGLGEHARAARLLGALERLLEVLHTQLPLMWRRVHGSDVSAVREALGAEAFDAAWEEGRAMPLDQAIAHALE